MISLKNIQLNKEIEEIKHLNFETVRTDNDCLFEAVLSNNELADLAKSLEKVFGLAKWPSEKGLSLEIQEKINDFGGIRSEQVLYFLQVEEDCLFAMLWPWRDGEHITLKIFCK
jgi:hypothetical protein